MLLSIIFFAFAMKSQELQIDPELPKGESSGEEAYIWTTSPCEISHASIATSKASNVPPSTDHSFTYRPDIDGLRALAVIPVIVFHAYPSVVTGGFIGVDIFFVISGYLISGILFQECRAGKFSYRGFYARRIRRIFPCLLLVMAFTIILGCLWYLAKPLRNMAATLWAGAMFGANLQVLLLKQGYFDANVKEDPLLHLWSLGVEEQYYIFWPLLITLIVKLSYHKAIIAQVTVVLVSFWLNIGMLGFRGDNNWSFYFPLCRFWQMSIGGLLVYIGPCPQCSSGRFFARIPRAIVSSIISLVGLGMIVWGVVVIDEQSAFPGYWSLLPTLGAACLIYAGVNAVFNKYILSLSPVVFVGKISYALYLWHWPLLVYAKAHYPNDDFRPWHMMPYMMVIYSFLFSVLTLHVVENRIRRRKSKWVIPILAVSMLLIVGIGIALYYDPKQFSMLEPTLTSKENNMPVDQALAQPNMSRPPRKAQPTLDKLLAAEDDWDPDAGFSELEDDSPFGYYENAVQINAGHLENLVIVLGDSHAEMLRPRFKFLYDQALQKGEDFPMMVFLTHSGRPPLQCMAEHFLHMNVVYAMKPKVVFYATDWPQFIRPFGENGHGEDPQCCDPGYIDDCSYQGWEDAHLIIDQFREEVTKLTTSGTKVFVATMNPEGPPFHYKNMLQGTNIVATKPVLLSDYRQKHDRLITMIENATRTANATIIDLADNQCFENVCEVVSTAEGELIMKDRDHFRPYFSRNYLSVLDQIIAATNH